MGIALIPIAVLLLVLWVTDLVSGGQVIELTRWIWHVLTMLLLTTAFYATQDPYIRVIWGVMAALAMWGLYIQLKGLETKHLIRRFLAYSAVTAGTCTAMVGSLFYRF